LVTNVIGVEGFVIERQFNDQNSHLSFDLNVVKAFFEWNVFVGDSDGLDSASLVKSGNSVSEDFRNLAGVLGGVTRGLEDDV